MAYRFFPLYNLECAVGLNAPNRQDDVKLVQGLFEIMFDDPRYYTFFVSRVQKLGLQLQSKPRITGQCDADLQAVIAAFQSIFPTYIKDGRLDPIPTTGGLLFDVHARGKKQFVLFQLIKTALQANPSKYMSLGKRIGLNYCASLSDEDIILPS